MKKIGTILLATILICSLAGCIANKEENQNPVVRGVITEVNSQNLPFFTKEKVTFLLVEGKQEEDTSYGKASVKVTKRTKIYRGDKKVSIEDLKENLLVEAYTSGPVAESYPVQMEAEKIVILGEKEKVTIKGVITDLIEKDEKVSVLIKGIEENLYVYARISFDEETEVYLNNERVPATELKLGQEIEVLYYGEIALSYPAHMEVNKVYILNNGEIVEETPLIRGEITELNKDRETVELLVEGEIEEDTEYDKAKVTLHEYTKIHRNEEEAKVEDLKEGMTVEIYYRGGVDMSYPVLMGADKIIILE